jgi:hypothetical protein
VQTFEYKTEVLTSMVGRDKLRMADLDQALREHGVQGWELVSVALDADLKGTRDGHLLIFKRPLRGDAAAEASGAGQPDEREAGDAFAQGYADADRAAREEEQPTAT